MRDAGDRHLEHLLVAAVVEELLDVRVVGRYSQHALEDVMFAPRDGVHHHDTVRYGLGVSSAMNMRCATGIGLHIGSPSVEALDERIRESP